LARGPPRPGSARRRPAGRSVRGSSARRRRWGGAACRRSRPDVRQAEQVAMHRLAREHDGAVQPVVQHLSVQRDRAPEREGRGAAEADRVAAVRLRDQDDLAQKGGKLAEDLGRADLEQGQGGRPRAATGTGASSTSMSSRSRRRQRSAWPGPSSASSRVTMRRAAVTACGLARISSSSPWIWSMRSSTAATIRST
jgi:hypothetical protein